MKFPIYNGKLPIILISFPASGHRPSLKETLGKQPYMRDSRVKRHKMLQDAFFFLSSAREIILRAGDLKMLPPEEEDFCLLQKLYEKSHDMPLVITYVENCLHQRLLGKEEPPPPWNTPSESPTDSKS